jgi:hypothetical protein
MEKIQVNNNLTPLFTEIKVEKKCQDGKIRIKVKRFRHFGPVRVIESIRDMKIIRNAEYLRCDKNGYVIEPYFEEIKEQKGQ